MLVSPLDIPEVRLITPRRFADPRGHFAEVYSAQRWRDAGISDEFVQDNQSYSGKRGTVRGLHFQRPPAAQAKLVRVLRGAIFDVAVDIRRGSPTFGRHVGVRLSAGEGNQIYVPVGFAHGFCTLEPETEVIYKVSDYYSPEHESGVYWNDLALKIEWPLAGVRPTISDKDAALPGLLHLPAYFNYLA